MKATLLAPIIAAAGVSASPAEIVERQSCPSIYIFGARETTVAPGYGTAGGLVNQVLAAYPGSQASPIDYPACGGQASCGGVPYDQSATQGTAAVVSAVTSLNTRCPSTQIVLIGYSQGGQIMDNALCGGAGATLTGAALAAVKVAIFMGDPHNVAGLPYNVGTCTAGGFAARPSGFQCAPASPSIIKSYCDSTDPYCCNGNDANSHQQYVVKYGAQALDFIKSKLSSSGGSTPAPGNGGGTGGCSVAKWGQCGGSGFTGCTTCVSGSTCQAQSQYYSQCL
ncbi:cutinase-domain-containing protein [Nemania abortiva]|nr:cutinase-domain-containing protein [Nemania abortiva]